MKKKQQGNIILIILALVAIIGLIAAYMMSGNTNSSSASSSSDSVSAASVMNDGTAFQQVYQSLLLNGFTSSNIAFAPNTVDPHNMLDPTNGVGIQMPIPEVGAFVVHSFPYGYWLYNAGGLKGNGIGTSAADPAVYLIGIKDSACAQINYVLHGSTAIPNPGIAVTTWTSGAASPLMPISNGGVDLSTTSSVSDWMSGCVGTSLAGYNAYYQILQVI